MVRAIKFRVWISNRNTMSQPFTLGEYAADQDGEYGELEFGYSDDKPVFMQFTGLLDKHGKEIYEGDIWCLTDENYTVVFEAPRFKFITKDSEFNWITYEYEEGQVIGNIYENPELLK